jgi:hypothetical protein
MCNVQVCTCACARTCTLRLPCAHSSRVHTGAALGHSYECSHYFSKKQTLTAGAAVQLTCRTCRLRPTCNLSSFHLCVCVCVYVLCVCVGVLCVCVSGCSLRVGRRRAGNRGRGGEGSSERVTERQRQEQIQRGVGQQSQREGGKAKGRGRGKREGVGGKRGSERMMKQRRRRRQKTS